MANWQRFTGKNEPVNFERFRESPKRAGTSKVLHILQFLRIMQNRY